MPVMPFCCGPPDCGCARPMKISTSGLTTASPITLDGTHTATMPSMVDVTDLELLTVETDCYLLSAANAITSGPASVNSGAASFDIYLLVWWTSDGPNVFIGGLQPGASWDNLVVLFYAVLRDGSVCCDNINGVNDDHDNELVDMGSVGDVINIAVPDLLVTAGLFANNNPSLVIGSTDGSIENAFILCCPMCFYTTPQPNATVSVSGACSALFNGSDYAFRTETPVGEDNGDAGEWCGFVWDSPTCTLHVIYDKATGVYRASLVSRISDGRFGSDDTDPYDFTIPITGSLSCVDGVLTGTFTIPGNTPDPPTNSNDCVGQTATVTLG